MKHLIFGLALLATGAAAAEPDVSPLQGAEVVLLGEVHDNPGHHQMQAAAVAALKPRALVFEMLTAEQAARVGEERGDAEAMARELGWAASGWPDFSMYHPIFTAAPEAQVYGAALPREAARAALREGVAASFGENAELYGLTFKLPEDVQKAREAEQAAAHCDALPAELLPGMVDLQRLRDAMLARAAIEALDATGGPVVVITGNGHARRDGGVPEVLTRVRNALKVVSVGQAEGDRIEGEYDLVWPGPLVKRRDPCETLREG